MKLLTTILERHNIDQLLREMMHDARVNSFERDIRIPMLLKAGTLTEKHHLYRTLKLEEDTHDKLI